MEGLENFTTSLNRAMKDDLDKLFKSKKKSKLLMKEIHKHIFDLGEPTPVSKRTLRQTHLSKVFDGYFEILKSLDVLCDIEFYISRFVDYSGEDGLFRKYRVVLIDGRPYASHMAISEHWMIHYLNGGMDESADKREEEASFMRGFDENFAARHREALSGIAERIGLEYLVIDCAETQDGQLLVFEVDSSAVVHAMDSPELYPYKKPQMRKVFEAFRAMLMKAIAAPQSGF